MFFLEAYQLHCITVAGSFIYQTMQTMICIYKVNAFASIPGPQGPHRKAFFLGPAFRNGNYTTVVVDGVPQMVPLGSITASIDALLTPLQSNLVITQARYQSNVNISYLHWNMEYITEF